MNWLGYMLIIIGVALPAWGRMHLAHIDNRTNAPFTLGMPGSARVIRVAPNAITPLKKRVKLSTALDHTHYQPWQLQRGDSLETFIIQYNGPRYDMCGMRALWHEKGPYLVAISRNREKKRVEECIVGPRDTALSLTLHQRDEGTDIAIMPGDEYTRILK
ncbi:MAG: hypothetical protein WD068_01660 [Candidatus Babeliales bacterium]